MKYFCSSLLILLLLAALQPANASPYKRPHQCSAPVSVTDTLLPENTAFRWGVINLPDRNIPTATFAVADNGKQNSSIRLTLFSVQPATPDYALLNWVAEEAQSFDHYELEYSTDGKEFFTGAVLFTSSTDKSNSYKYKFLLKQNSTYWFRLKMINSDKSIAYSPVKLM